MKEEHMKRVVTIVMLMVVLAISAGIAFAEEAAEAVPVLNSGDTAWMMISTALVMLMSIPGLALFYGGLAKRKDVLNTMAMTFVSFCIVSVLWVVYGYTLAFGSDIGGFIGSMEKFFLKGVTASSLSGTYPEYVFIVFQLTFAAITVALVSGAWIERIKFPAWILFTILWVTLVYLPVAHWVWGGGFLAEHGALDFAGGTVVHINAGIAALVGALVLGKRKDTSLIPGNLTLVVIGIGLLWFGWFGFNAGSALAADGIAGAAFINTNTATAIAACAWMFTEWMHAKKPTVLGLASGAVAWCCRRSRWYNSRRWICEYLRCPCYRGRRRDSLLSLGGISQSAPRL